MRYREPFPVWRAVLNEPLCPKRRVVMISIKARLVLATAVLGLLFIGPVAPPTYASDCPSAASSGCSG